ncbi:MAG: TPM domain-containing protein [Chitinophagaceae bacterium]|nr:TPM domain-containing protein [Chitinophagaceae bacterium]
MFKWLKHKAEDYFSIQEKQTIAHAIHQVELQTSGEVRVYVESKCRYVDAMDRAKEIFDKLDMHKTEAKNAVLVYVAIKDRQVAIYADEGIYKKMGIQFWNNELQLMIQNFKNEHIVEGIIKVIHDLGTALTTHFPYQKDDINELPNEVVFGK